eukprot:489591_1
MSVTAQCINCDQQLPLSSFSRTQLRKRNGRSKCKRCVSMYMQTSKKNNASKQYNQTKSSANRTTNKDCDTTERDRSRSRSRGRNSRFDIKPDIATFDINGILNESLESPPYKLNSNLLTYFHTDRAQTFLEHSNITPFEIKTETLTFCDSIKIDLNQIPINYEGIKNDNTKSSGQSLNEQKPSVETFDAIFGAQVSPLHTQIKHLLNTIRPLPSSSSPPNNSGDSSDTTPSNKPATFITFRRNLRCIASVILHKLNLMRIYDRTGINIAVFWNGTHVVLENIKEVNPNKKHTPYNPFSLYGFLWEHTLHWLSNETTQTDVMDSITSMNVNKHAERDEIRALLQLKMDDNINIVCAAEMDCILRHNDNAPNECLQVVELKCSTIVKPKQNKPNKIEGIRDGKLLKMWLQCYFGGVDKLIIAFHEAGVIQSIKQLNTVEIQSLFPMVTSKCIQMVHDVLLWLQETMTKAPVNSLYHLSFNTHWKNTQFVLKPLSLTEMDQKEIIELMNSKTLDHLKKGLTINAFTKEIQLTSI